jgi:hypothetical protein
MNLLSLRVDPDNDDELGLSFVLVVDGCPIGDLVSTQVDSHIPWWIVEDGLPTLLGRQAASDPEMRIVAVCSCGEYGCGHTRCRVLVTGDQVVFEGFENDVSDTGRTRRFVFERSNYDAVIAELVTLAAECRKRSETRRR